MTDLRKLINIVEGMAITDAWFKDGSFQTYKLPVPVAYRIADKPGFLKTLENPKFPYEAGHYIMGPGPKDEYWALEPSNFHDKYVDNGDGTGTPKGGVVKIAKLADHDGVVKASWGDLRYRRGEDFIVRHGDNDYGVIDKDVFQKTYKRVE
jgi:hypothetical protein